MSKSESEQNLLKMKAAEAQATAARLAKVVQTHAELLAAHKKDGSLDDSSQWPAVWAGAIASGFGHYAFTTDWTGGAPHPFWTAGAHPTGGDWTAWATGTWAGAGQFYGDPKIYYGKQVWANLTCGGVRRRRSQFIPVQQRRRTTDRQIWGVFLRDRRLQYFVSIDLHRRTIGLSWTALTLDPEGDSQRTGRMRVWRMGSKTP